MDAKDLTPGQSVRLRDLANAATLNGLVGTLLQRDEKTGRWQVDLGQHGVKALLPKNLVLESAEEEDEEDQVPGNLIGRLLGSDQDEGPTTKQSDEFDDIDAIAEGIDEDHILDEALDEGELEAEQEDIAPEEPEPEDAEDAEPVDAELEADEEMKEAEPEEAEPEEGELEEGEVEEGDPDEAHFDEAEPDDEHFDDAGPDEVDPDEVLDPPDQEEEHHDGTSTQGQEAFDPEEPPEKPVDVDEEPPDFAKMSVKELKAFLQVRGVRIPAWVTEKSDLLSLVKDSAHLPIRPPEAQKEKEEAKKKEEETTAQQKPAEEEKQPEQTPDSTNKGGVPSPPWQPPGGGGWSYSAPRANVPNMANLGGGFGWPPMWGGCPAPPIFPQHGFQPWVRPAGAPMFPPRAPYPAPAATAVPAARPAWPPKSVEDAVFYRDHRLRTIRMDERVREKLRHFCKKHHFSREVEHGLRMLNELTANSILSDHSLSAKLEKSADPHDTLLAELDRRDKATATVMRWLVPAKAQRNPEPRQSASRSRRSRSRRRRRRSTPPRSPPKRSSPKRTERRSPMRRNPPPGRPPTPPRARRRKDKSPTSPPPGSFVPAPSSKQGIFRSPTPSPSSPPAAAQSTNTVYEEEAPEEAENEVREWLRGLDSGRGALVIYTKAITEEFGGVPALSACILPEHPKGSVIGRIEQSLWEALDVKSLGHRLLLAKGILKLE